MPKTRFLKFAPRCWTSVAALTLVALAPLTTRAQLLAYESWDYTTGTDNASGQTGGFGWDGGWQSISNDANIASGSLTPMGDSGALLTAANSVLLASGNFHRIGRNLDLSVDGVFDSAGLINSSGDIGADDTTLYVSFLMQTGATDGFFEFEFHRNNLGDPGRIGGVGDDANGTNFNVRTPSLGRANDFAVRDTDTHFMVVRIDFLDGSDTVSIFMDPTLGIESVADLTLVGAGDFSFDGISLAGLHEEVFDEIRFGTTFASVSPSAVPEPSTYALMFGAGALGFAACRRRRAARG